MPTSFPIPEKAAPIFGRTRVGTSPGVYWKCKIGRRVHLAREEAEGRNKAHIANLTRETLAQRLGILPQRLWEIENGLLAIDGAEIAQIAEALNIHPGWFFDDASWEDWSITSIRRTPTWILAKTIGELERGIRDLLEQLVILLDAREARRQI
jgi:transcriptional regulator with XRE-family HTH domain